MKCAGFLDGGSLHHPSYFTLGFCNGYLEVLKLRHTNYRFVA